MISAGAKGRSAIVGYVRCQYDDGDASVVLCIFQCLAHFVDGRGAEGVQDVWPIEGYASDVIGRGDVIGDVFEGLCEVKVVVDGMGGDDVEAVAAGSWRRRFGGGAGCAH